MRTILIPAIIGLGLTGFGCGQFDKETLNVRSLDQQRQDVPEDASLLITEGLSAVTLESSDISTLASEATLESTPVPGSGALASPKDMLQRLEAPVAEASAGNSPPVLGNIPNGTGGANLLAWINFTMSDAETPSANLVVSVSSSNSALAPAARFRRTVTPQGWNYLLIRPIKDKTGSSTVRVNVSDGTTTVSRTFILKIVSVNKRPTLQPIADRRGYIGLTDLISIHPNDVETPAENLPLFVSSDNLAVVPPGNVQYHMSSFPGPDRLQLWIKPAAYGVANVGVQVTDLNFSSGIRWFKITVLNPADFNPPIMTFTGIPDVITMRLNSSRVLNFTVASTFENPSLVTVRGHNRWGPPELSWTVNGSGANRSVTIRTGNYLGPVGERYNEFSIIGTGTNGFYGWDTVRVNFIP